MRAAAGLRLVVALLVCLEAHALTHDVDASALWTARRTLLLAGSESLRTAWPSHVDPCGPVGTCCYEATNMTGSRSTDPCPWQGVCCRAGRVTVLNIACLGGCARGHMRGVRLTSVADLPQLRTLNISGNTLTGPLPSSWSRLTSLRVLDASRNQFSGSLPGAWGQLSRLGLLALNNNDLKGSLPPAWSGLLSLAYFSMASNDFSGQVPAAWSAMRSLALLDARSNCGMCGGLPFDKQRVVVLTTGTALTRSCSVFGCRTALLVAVITCFSVLTVLMVVGLGIRMCWASSFRPWLANRARRSGAASVMAPGARSRGRGACEKCEHCSDCAMPMFTLDVTALRAAGWNTDGCSLGGGYVWCQDGGADQGASALRERQQAPQELGLSSEASTSRPHHMDQSLELTCIITRRETPSGGGEVDLEAGVARGQEGGGSKRHVCRSGLIERWGTSMIPVGNDQYAALAVMPGTGPELCVWLAHPLPDWVEQDSCAHSMQPDPSQTHAEGPQWQPPHQYEASESTAPRPPPAVHHEAAGSSHSLLDGASMWVVTRMHSPLPLLCMASSGVIRCS